MAKAKRAVTYDGSSTSELDPSLQAAINAAGGQAKFDKLVKQHRKQLHWESSISYVQLGDPGFDSADAVRFHNGDAKYRRICNLFELQKNQIREVAQYHEARLMGLPMETVKSQEVKRDADRKKVDEKSGFSRERDIAVRNRITMAKELAAVMESYAEWLQLGCPRGLPPRKA